MCIYTTLKGETYLKKLFSKKLILFLTFSTLLVLAACGGNTNETGEGEETPKKETIEFADAGWDSIRFHNSVAQTVLENGFGYKTDVTQGSTPATVTGLTEGDIDVYMEVWIENVKDIYNEGLEEGSIVELSTNFDDNKQGLYVPTYVIEGDPERGIEPMAPELETVEDLKKYPELFEDPENPDIGRIYGPPTGWGADAMITRKYEGYGLDESYNLFHPGSGTALATSIVTANDDGEPWVGYYWEPTWIMGLYDMTLLKEPEYDKETFNESGTTAFPSVPVTIAAHESMTDAAPEVVDFLKNYETSSDLTNEALAYMQENDASAEAAAHWWMKKHEDLWTSWLPEDIATKVTDSLE